MKHLLIEEQHLFDLMMDIWYDSKNLINPHVAGEYIIEKIDILKEEQKNLIRTKKLKEY